jgi:hypothetical protein
VIAGSDFQKLAYPEDYKKFVDGRTDHQDGV